MIILITGKAGAGKDTIGDYLRNKYGFKSDSLAAPIKRLVQDIFVLPKEVVYDRELRELPLKDPWGGKTVRYFLQKIGTEMFRNQIDPDIWVLSLWLRMKSEPETNWVITDLRFPNEKDVLVKKWDGEVITIKVLRPGWNGKTKGGIENHESEKYDIPADFVVNNDGSIEKLYTEVDSIIAKCQRNAYER